MAVLEFDQKRTNNPHEISALMAAEGLAYAHWGAHATMQAADSTILETYRPEIEALKEQGSYCHTDLVALKPDTPRLAEICAKFSREHHHSEDEVRFTVEGEGVFEIASADGAKMLKITTYPGDLIVIPAMRRHLFYLTEKQHIRCIRLFQDPKGWEAIYEKKLG